MKGLINKIFGKAVESKKNLACIEKEYSERINNPCEDKENLAKEINRKIDTSRSRETRLLYYKLYIDLTNVIAHTKHQSALPLDIPSQEAI